MSNNICRFPQGSILGPVLLLIYVNSLPSASVLLDQVVLADDVNLFFSQKVLKISFNTISNELGLIRKLVNTNKLSLNTDKTSLSFFQKSSRKDGIPLRLTVLRMDKLVIERKSSSIVFEVLLNEMITWNHHFHLLQSNISKSMRLMYEAKF